MDDHLNAEYYQLCELEANLLSASIAESKFADYEVLSVMSPPPSFAFVSRSQLRTSELVVVKGRAASGDAAELRIEEEAYFAAKCSKSPFVLAPIDFCRIPGSGIPFTVTPFAIGRSLRHRMLYGRMSYEEIAYHSISALTSLSHVHSHSIVHGDLKPENLLLAKSEVATSIANRKGWIQVLMDFGFATESTNKSLRTVARGTKPYMAPELWKGAGQSEKSDIWAWGMLTIELLLRKHPFVESVQNVSEANFNNILNSHFGRLSEIEESYLSWLGHLARNATVYDANSRPSANLLLENVGQFLRVGDLGAKNPVISLEDQNLELEILRSTAWSGNKSLGAALYATDWAAKLKVAEELERVPTATARLSALISIESFLKEPLDWKTLLVAFTNEPNNQSFQTFGGRSYQAGRKEPDIIWEEVPNEAVIHALSTGCKLLLELLLEHDYASETTATLAGEFCRAIASAGWPLTPLELVTVARMMCNYFGAYELGQKILRLVVEEPGSILATACLMQEMSWAAGNLDTVAASFETLGDLMQEHGEGDTSTRAYCYFHAAMAALELDDPVRAHALQAKLPPSCGEAMLVRVVLAGRDHQPCPISEELLERIALNAKGYRAKFLAVESFWHFRNHELASTWASSILDEPAISVIINGRIRTKYRAIAMGNPLFVGRDALEFVKSKGFG